MARARIDGALRGVRALVTRPRARAGALREMIERRGGEAVLLPAGGIAAARDPAGLFGAPSALARAAFAVFVSVSAVAGPGRALRGENLRPPKKRPG
ncbi:MAG: hypothetical protein MPK10_05075, partial [Gammaproteobacteria bacterium]|nr:hypothetical protein [Gammaproteobacteria bacterium]